MKEYRLAAWPELTPPFDRIAYRRSGAVIGNGIWRTVIEFEPALFGAAANNGLMIGEVSRKAKATEQFRALTAVLARRTALPEREEGFLAPILARIARLRSAG